MILRSIKRFSPSLVRHGLSSLKAALFGLQFSTPHRTYEALNEQMRPLLHSKAGLRHTTTGRELLSSLDITFPLQIQDEKRPNISSRPPRAAMVNYNWFLTSPEAKRAEGGTFVWRTGAKRTLCTTPLHIGGVFENSNYQSCIESTDCLDALSVGCYQEAKGTCALITLSLGSHQPGAQNESAHESRWTLHWSLRSNVAVWLNRKDCYRRSHRIVRQYILCPCHSIEAAVNQHSFYLAHQNSYHDKCQKDAGSSSI